jgi:site-specific DNA-methyltransferase (adenine-specific)
MYGQGNGCPTVRDTYGDTGGASRYFTTFRYTPKASRSERNRGCSDLPSKAAGGLEGRRDGSLGKVTMAHNIHPTVKPLALMSWLIGLITPPGGLVLDPFAGSGSTLVAAKEGGWRYLGIEREAEYVAIAQARLEAAPSITSAAKPKSKPKRARKSVNVNPPIPWEVA